MQRYFAELENKEELLEPIRVLAVKKRITLLFGAAATECNNAVALMEHLNTARPGVRQGRQNK
jgi:uncharacterized protein YeaO (DUF488 family)